MIISACGTETNDATSAMVTIPQIETSVNESPHTELVTVSVSENSLTNDISSSTPNESLEKIETVFLNNESGAEFHIYKNPEAEEDYWDLCFTFTNNTGSDIENIMEYIDRSGVFSEKGYSEIYIAYPLDMIEIISFENGKFDTDNSEIYLPALYDASSGIDLKDTKSTESSIAVMRTLKNGEYAEGYISSSDNDTYEGSSIDFEELDLTAKFVFISSAQYSEKCSENGFSVPEGVYIADLNKTADSCEFNGTDLENSLNMDTSVNCEYGYAMIFYGKENTYPERTYWCEKDVFSNIDLDSIDDDFILKNKVGQYPKS